MARVLVMRLVVFLCKRDDVTSGAYVNVVISLAGRVLARACGEYVGTNRIHVGLERGSAKSQDREREWNEPQLISYSIAYKRRQSNKPDLGACGLRHTAPCRARFQSEAESTEDAISFSLQSGRMTKQHNEIARAWAGNRRTSVDKYAWGRRHSYQSHRTVHSRKMIAKRREKVYKYKRPRSSREELVDGGVALLVLLEDLFDALG